MEGALAAASAAYEGFAEDRDPFVASAALTVGMVRMSRGDDGSARRYLLEVDRVGSRFGIQWLKSSARTHLAIIDVHGLAWPDSRRGEADLRARVAEQVGRRGGKPPTRLGTSCG